MNPDIFPKFSSGEYARRLTAVRDHMARRGLDALVVYGDAGAQGHNHANIMWLANWMDVLAAYLLVLPDGDPRLFVSNPLYRHTAVRASNLPSSQIEVAGLNPGRTLGERLRDQGLGAGRIGLCGVRNVGRSTMPYEHYIAMRDLLPDATFEDAGNALQEARLIKSAEEIAWFERGAHFTDLTIESLAENIRIGMPEYELSALIQGAFLHKGGRLRMHFVAATPMEAPEFIFPWQHPSHRPLGRGDIVMTEISAGYGGCSGQIQRPFAVGGAPTTEYQTLYDVAAECYHRVFDALRPGATDADVRNAAGFVDQRGYKTLDVLLHGWGWHIEPPRVDLANAMIKRDVAPVTFREGMLVVIQPHIVSPDERRGVQVGNLVLIESSGARSLQRYPVTFIRAG